MNRELFSAILAMDAYNRGYGVGVDQLAASGQLGNATIRFDSFNLGGVPSNRVDQSAGFYAIAYDVSGVDGFSATSNDFTSRVVSQFLYREDETPDNVADERFIGRPTPPRTDQPTNENSNIIRVNTQDFIDGPGRFARASFLNWYNCFLIH